MGRFLAVLAVVLLGLCPRAEARDVPVDLELVIAVDVSRSIDEEEARLQRQGYVEAFRDEKVIRAIRSGMLRRIAVAYVEWAGSYHSNIVAEWTAIEDTDGAHRFAGMLAASTPSVAMRTSISGAIDFALPWFDGNGFEGTRRVIDISGDGPNNNGDLVPVARDRAVAKRVTINGLPILDDGGGMFTRYNIPDLDLYYRNCVIGGPGAFIEVAANFRDFARAVRRKLILEIAGRQPPKARIIPAQARRKARVSPPCDIGERIMRQSDDF